MKNMKIRPYELHEAQVLYEAVRESIPDLAPWLPWCHQDYSLEESKEWISVQIQKRKNKEEFEFAIFDNCGTFLGGCGLNHIDWKEKTANLGYWVRSSAMGQGIAVKAVKLLSDWSFQNTELVQLEIKCAVGNMRSQRVAEKAGASKVGIRPAYFEMKGNKYDAIVYTIQRKHA